MPRGNRIFLKRNMPSEEILKGFKLIPTSNICDTKKVFSLSAEIKLMSSPLDEIMVGVALTVKTKPKDNLMIHQALEMSGEGDILVISNEGDKECALIGEIMSSYAFDIKKITGFVLDGSVRDINEISKMKTPIYATEITPGGPSSEGPGEINAPVEIGGVTIYPGDIIVGDKDGVIVIPYMEAKDILEEAKIMLIKDCAKVEAAKNGTVDKSWVAAKLEEIECEIINDFYK